MDLSEYVRQLNEVRNTGRATESTYRPALKAFIESYGPELRAHNEPSHIECGAPDLAVTRAEEVIGYVETKDLDLSLDQIEKTNQIKRYLRSIPNLLLTNYREFRLYHEGEEVLRTAPIVQHEKNLKKAADTESTLLGLLSAFTNYDLPVITDPEELAKRLAKTTHIVRDIIAQQFERERETELLRDWRKAFSATLMPELELPEKTGQFADMVAQTIAYGLFSARLMDPTPSDFSRNEAQRLIPKSNPFLRDFFYQLTGPRLDDEPFATFVDDLVHILHRTDVVKLLEGFGAEFRRGDPIFHFYETYLAAYDPDLREKRGVYYTPQPVVDFITRGSDDLLKKQFGISEGLADSQKIRMANLDPSQRQDGKKKQKKYTQIPKVLVLDPACGTGTFLARVIHLIREKFRQKGDTGLWQTYVRDSLLERLIGFEILVASYAVAHFKLALILAGRGLPADEAEDWHAVITDGERLAVYLTNTLAESPELHGLPLFTQWIADETAAANRVKDDLPIMVVLGNPPYANFGQMNRNDWILSLLDDYKNGLGEKKINLDDDYIKFIRFAQWRIDRTGSGIVGFVTNNSYLDGITHRRMRESLLESFDFIYVLNLHGDQNRKEKTPEGATDVNVFDIMQGVAIVFFIKTKGREFDHGEVFYADIYGDRATKYEALDASSIDNVDWTRLSPVSPYYFFVPRSLHRQAEYSRYTSIPDIFPVWGNGLKTDRDDLFVDIENDRLAERMEKFFEEDELDREFRDKYKIRDSSSYKMEKVRQNTFDEENIRRVLYRPFDWRWIYYAPSVTSRPAWKVMKNVRGEGNPILLTSRQVLKDFRHVHVTDTLVTVNGLDTAGRFGSGPAFPLWVRESEPTIEEDSSEWRANIGDDFAQKLAEALDTPFAYETGRPDGKITPEKVFGYVYAVLHSTQYRREYSELLTFEFPRIPVLRSLSLFDRLADLGWRLSEVHRFRRRAVGTGHYQFPVSGNNEVDRRSVGFYPEVDTVEGLPLGRVYINHEQYFADVRMDVWEHMVGGYQMAARWLTERAGISLSLDQINHYRQLLQATEYTRASVDQIDREVGWWSDQYAV